MVSVAPTSYGKRTLQLTERTTLFTYVFGIVQRIIYSMIAIGVARIASIEKSFKTCGNNSQTEFKTLEIAPLAPDFLC